MNKILEELKIEYNTINTKIHFELYGYKVFYDSITKKVYINESNFGKIPHVMSDGSICISANQEILFEEGDESQKFKNTIMVYLPYLLSLAPEMKTAEMIGEVDFYIRWLLKYKTAPIQFNEIKQIRKIEVYTPTDLWDTIYYMSVGDVIEVYPSELEMYSVIIKRKTENKFLIDKKEYFKACQRVVGNIFLPSDSVVGIIGVGSVNSYVIKEVLSQGVNQFVLIDNDIVEQGNLMRYAFPYIGKYKVNAAKKFIKSLCRPFGKVTAIKEYVNRESRNFLSTCNDIYISVDNYQSWLEIFHYIGKNMLFINKNIHLLGIDAFANYSKYIYISTNNPKVYADLYIKFLLHKVPNVERKEMVLNGCGKSLAIYNEFQLIELAKKGVNQNEINKTEVFPF